MKRYVYLLSFMALPVLGLTVLSCSHDADGVTDPGPVAKAGEGIVPAAPGTVNSKTFFIQNPAGTARKLKVTVYTITSGNFSGVDLTNPWIPGVACFSLGAPPGAAVICDNIDLGQCANWRQGQSGGTVAVKVKYFGSTAPDLNYFFYDC